MGAHVVTQRRGYTHHGIYVGAGKVVHYAGLARGLRRGPVEEISLSRFAAGHAVGILSGAPSKFDGQEVIRRARSRLGEDGYRLWTNNCEHFCEWCLRGESRSYQIEACLTLPSRALPAIGRLIIASTLMAALQSVLSPANHFRSPLAPDDSPTPFSPRQDPALTTPKSILSNVASSRISALIGSAHAVQG